MLSGFTWQSFNTNSRSFVSLELSQFESTLHSTYTSIKCEWYRGTLKAEHGHMHTHMLSYFHSINDIVSA